MVLPCLCSSLFGQARSFITHKTSYEKQNAGSLLCRAAVLIYNVRKGSERFPHVVRAQKMSAIIITTFSYKNPLL